MDISRNKITGEIKKGNLGKSFRAGDWENCLDSDKAILPQFQDNIDQESLNEAKEIKKTKINNQKNKIINSLTDLTKDGKKYFFDRGILSRQSISMAAISLGGNDTIEWITEDNSIVTLTNQDFLTICSNIMLTDAREIKLARLRKNAVLSLTSLEEVENYDITQIYID